MKVLAKPWTMNVGNDPSTTAWTFVSNCRSPPIPCSLSPGVKSDALLFGTIRHCPGAGCQSCCICVNLSCAVSLSPAQFRELMQSLLFVSLPCSPRLPPRSLLLTGISLLLDHLFAREYRECKTFSDKSKSHKNAKFMISDRQTDRQIENRQTTRRTDQ